MVYYECTGESAGNLEFMEIIDKLHLEDPSAGTRRMQCYIQRKKGVRLSRKRIRRLMRLTGIEAIYPRKRTTIPGGPSGIHPYLLNGLDITNPDQVWCADITYIPMQHGFMYLFAILDWFSRKVVAWELSTTLDTDFCLRCLNRALKSHNKPKIMNTDQGCQFTSDLWLKRLKDEDIRISMDGKGRWVDNVIVERFWRSIKYEDIYLKSYENPRELSKGIKAYIQRYNAKRPHQSLDEHTPDEVYTERHLKAA